MRALPASLRAKGRHITVFCWFRFSEWWHRSRHCWGSILVWMVDRIRLVGLQPIELRFHSGTSQGSSYISPAAHTGDTNSVSGWCMARPVPQAGGLSQDSDEVCWATAPRFVASSLVFYFLKSSLLRIPFLPKLELFLLLLRTLENTTHIWLCHILSSLSRSHKASLSQCSILSIIVYHTEKTLENIANLILVLKITYLSDLQFWHYLMLCANITFLFWRLLDKNKNL